MPNISDDDVKDYLKRGGKFVGEIAFRYIGRKYKPNKQESIFRCNRNKYQKYNNVTAWY